MNHTHIMSNHSNTTTFTDLFGSQNNNATIQNQNSTTTDFWDRPVTPSSPVSNGIAFALGMVLIMLCCWAIQPSIPTEEHRRAFAIRERARERFRRRHAMRKVTPEQRMEFVEKSLITKRVIDCDSEGNLTLGDVSKEDDLEQQQSPLDEVRSINSIESDDESSTCVICLAMFRVGDVVAWSRVNDECLHVFHRDCIVPWFQNPLHNDCPSCRSTILKVDSDEEGGLTTDDSEDDKPDDDGEFMGDHSERSNHSTSQIFVIMHGLISRARRASYSLIGQSIDTTLSFEDDDDDNCDLELAMRILPPSPGLRRVVSLGDRSTSSTGSARLQYLSLRRRVSLRSSNSEHQLNPQISPQIPKPTRISDRNFALPPLESMESLKQPMRLRRVVSADTESARRRRRRASGGYVIPPTMSSDDSASGSFMQVLRRASASSGAYARLANGEMDTTERSLDEDDVMLPQVPSIDSTHRSVSWSSDLVTSSSSQPPQSRGRSASQQQSSVDEDDEEYFGQEDVLSEEDDLQINESSSILAG